MNRAMLSYIRWLLGNNCVGFKPLLAYLIVPTLLLNSFLITDGNFILDSWHLSTILEVSGLSHKLLQGETGMLIAMTRNSEGCRTP